MNALRLAPRSALWLVASVLLFVVQELVQSIHGMDLKAAYDGRHIRHWMEDAFVYAPLPESEPRTLGELDSTRYEGGPQSTPFRGQGAL